MLADYRTATIADGLRATLGFLEKVTWRPDDVVPADAQAVLAAGVSRAALDDALRVMFLFNVYVRLADTLGWAIPTPDDFRRSAQMLLKRGYR